MSANYGIYGPAFELQEHTPRSPGSEEYAHSEKYEIRWWDLARPDSLSEFIARVNKIRRDHRALQFNDALQFHHVDNEQIIAYSKVRAVPADEGAAGIPGRDVIVTIVSLDHGAVQSGWVELDLPALGVDPDRPYVMHDLLDGRALPVGRMAEFRHARSRRPRVLTSSPWSSPPPPRRPADPAPAGGLG